MTTKQKVNAIYNEYYNSLERREKVQLTRLTNFIEMEMHLEPKMMSKILSCYLMGSEKMKKDSDFLWEYGKERKL